MENGWPATDSPQAWGIQCLKADTGAHGLSREPGKVHTGMNSGYAAINLAYLLGQQSGKLGATRILLIGFDMMMDGNKRHWFGAHPKGMDVNSNYSGFMERFRTIDPAAYGLEIWNCSRRTALRHFPVYDLDEVCGL